MRRSSRIAQTQATLPSRPAFKAHRTALPVTHTQPVDGEPTRALEARLWASGFESVCGVDEVGRGPLAGPVVACAVIIDKSVCLAGVRDSKQLSAARRSEIYSSLTAHPGVVWATAVIDVETIDHLNILQATLVAMEHAVQSLPRAADYVLVDGNRLPKSLQAMVPCEAVVRGDSESYIIAAASIIAKVERDLLMDAYDKQYPMYGFAQHKGYGTAAHMRAIKLHGPCPIHRRSFAPMKHMAT